MLLERAYFRTCLILGRLLRATKYSKARSVHSDGDPSTSQGSSRPFGELRADERQVRKSRELYAPLLIWMSGPLMRLLDTGVRVLAQRDWEERERLIYRSLYGASIRVDIDRTLVLPYLAGQTLAALLEDPAVDESIRKKAIERVVIALAEFHRLGFTHGDAMAENVLVDLQAGTARWFDFETIHDPNRSMAWRRADDVRALLVTCLVRTAPGRLAETLHLILDVYADEGVTRRLAESVSPALRRSLTFHLAQAGLSMECSREIVRLLRARVGQ